MFIKNQKNTNHNKNSDVADGQQTIHDSAYILPEALCTIENKRMIEKELNHYKTRIPKQLKAYYFEYQNQHQRKFLKRVNQIGQLAFLCYFFADWFLLPDVSILSAILRLSLVIITLFVSEYAFRHCQDIRVLDSLLPIYAIIGAASWIELLFISTSTFVPTYIYASVIFILLGNFSIQVSFGYSIITSFLISAVIIYGVFKISKNQESLVFLLTYIPILLLSMYISWNNTLNSKRNFLRVLLNDWNYYALCKLAHTDDLTNLNNRRQFMQVAEQAIHKWPQPHLSCLMMFDIDFFKKINDSYGHDVGDEVLRILADISLQSMRDTDVLARFGGEEFIALLPNTTLEDAVILANQLCKKIQSHQIDLEDKSFFNFSVSIGVSQLQANQKDLNVLIKNADIALYQAKKNGRNQVVVFS